MATESLALFEVSWSCPSLPTVTTRAVSRYLPGFGTSTSQLNAPAAERLQAAQETLHRLHAPAAGRRRNRDHAVRADGDLACPRP